VVSEDTAIAGAGRHIMIRTGDELTLSQLPTSGINADNMYNKYYDKLVFPTYLLHTGR